MPEPAFAETSADLDRLKSRLSVVDLSAAQRVICLEITHAAVSGEPLRQWKDIARDYGMDPGQLSRAKALLGLIVVETDSGLRVNLDDALWFPANTQGQALKGLARRIARDERRLPESGSANTSNSRSGQLDNRNCQIAGMSNSQCEQVDNPPRTPNTEAHAGAPLGLASSSGEKEPERRGREADPPEAADEPVWSPGELERLVPFAASLAAPLIGEGAARKFAEGVRKFAPRVERLALRHALIWFSIRSPRDDIRHPVSWVRTLAETWSVDDGPDVEQLAAIHRWEREHRPPAPPATIVFPDRSRPPTAFVRPIRHPSQIPAEFRQWTDPGTNRAQAFTG